MAKSPKFCFSCCTVSFCFCLFILEVSTLVIAIYFAIGGLRDAKDITTVKQCLIAILIVLIVQFLIGILLACIAIICCCCTIVIWTEAHEIRAHYEETWQGDEIESLRASTRIFEDSSLELSGFRRFQERIQGYVPFNESRDFSVSSPPSYSQFAQSNLIHI